MERRTLFAVVLSLAIIMLYTPLIRMFYPTYGMPQEDAATEVAAPPAPAADDNLSSELPPQKTGESLPAGTPASEPIFKTYGPYAMEISPETGALMELDFNTYNDPETGEPLEFLRAADPENGALYLELWVNGELQATNRFKTTANAEAFIGVQETDGYTVTKTFQAGVGEYANAVALSYKNTSAAKQIIQFRLSTGSSPVIRNTIGRQYVEANWVTGEKVRHVNPLGFFYKLFRKPTSTEEPIDAASIKSRHFSSLLKPMGDTAYRGEVRAQNKNVFTSYLVSPKISLAPKESFTDEYFYFLGPTKAEIVEQHGLGMIVNFGKLDAICKVLIGIMQMVYGVVHNYGVAIILLTLLMNIALMPLTKTSFMSMRRMQLVQPEMQRIREKYKNDMQKLNKEMTDLYRKHKVNPAGGCLPMFLQMPIFISLYVGLSKSTELLNAKFLWVKDLASPDNVHLPFSLPLFGDKLHVLPLIMVLAMVIQQKISMANMPQSDPNVARQQKIMMTFMPIFFGFIFYPMPSGLVLYWLTNTIAMSSYQAYLRKQHVTPAPKSIR